MHPPASARPTAGRVAEIARLEPAAALATLGSSRRGLEGPEAARRLLAAGPNTLPRPARRSVARELIGQLTNMFAVLLVVAAGLTVVIYALATPRDLATLELAFGILAIVVLNAVIGFAQEHAAERTAEALQAMVPRIARVLRGGALEELIAEEVVPGDVVVLEVGDAVPADCRVIEAHGLSVEMATLTGESSPIARVEAPTEPRELVEARNCCLVGSSVTSGSGKAVVFATGIKTEFGRIYQLTAAMAVEPSPLQRQVADMARKVAAVAISVGLLLFGLRAGTGQSLTVSFVFALGVMVALVPEGLPATLSVSLAVAVRRMARRHALIKRLAAVEALGSTTVICTDKTGTLTTAEMTVRRIFSSGRFHEVTGVGYAPVGVVEDAGQLAALLEAAALCCDARLVEPDESRDAGWRVVGDPTEGAILVAAKKAGVDLVAAAASAERVGVVPFDPSRKLMTTFHRGVGGYRAFLKGSPDAVLARCDRTRRGHKDVLFDRRLRTEAERANDEMAGEAMRVLAIAEREVSSAHPAAGEAETGFSFLGLVGMTDPPRPEVLEAIAACRRAGIGVLMVTGDYGLTGEAIARRVGLVGEEGTRVVTGNELDELDDGGLAEVLASDPPPLFARVRPEHKLRIVAALEDLGEIVAVTGDGANDAPALKRASVGVAMGRSGTDVARAAAVMILLDDSFASIAAAVELGRAVYQNIRRFLVYVFTSNLAEVAPILVASFVGFPLVPLSALQVLAIDLGSDVLPALALGTERAEKGTMTRPPRPTSEHLLSPEILRRIVFLGTLQAAGVVVAFFWRIHSAHLAFSDFDASNPVYREALTMSQAAIVVSQLFNSFTIRTDRESVLRAGLWSNLPLLGAGALGVAFMAGVSYLPPLQRLFHTAPLSLADWLIVLAFGATLLAADELRKAFHRNAARRRHLANDALAGKRRTDGDTDRPRAARPTDGGSELRSGTSRADRDNSR